MKVYLIVYPCEDGVHVCAAEVDHEKAEKLYKIYHDDDKEVYRTSTLWCNTWEAVGF